MNGQITEAASNKRARTPAPRGLTFKYSTTRYVVCYTRRIPKLSLLLLSLNSRKSCSGTLSEELRIRMYAYYMQWMYSPYCYTLSSFLIDSRSSSRGGESKLNPRSNLSDTKRYSCLRRKQKRKEKRECWVLGTGHSARLTVQRVTYHNEIPTNCFRKSVTEKLCQRHTFGHRYSPYYCCCCGDRTNSGGDSSR